jgi:hypothetical protein
VYSLRILNKMYLWVNSLCVVQDAVKKMWTGHFKLWLVHVPVRSSTLLLLEAQRLIMALEALAGHHRVDGVKMK